MRVKLPCHQLLQHLHPPTEGDIEFEGKSIYADVATYRFSIGFCPQKPNLNSALTLEQNLRLSGSYYQMTKEQIDKRLAQLG